MHLRRSSSPLGSWCAVARRPSSSRLLTSSMRSRSAQKELSTEKLRRSTVIKVDDSHDAVSFGTVQMMSALPQKTLKVVPAPLALDAVDDAPPVWEAVSPTVEYTCGNCGAVLMRANEVKPIHALIVHCTSCDTYNSTHSE